MNGLSTKRWRVTRQAVLRRDKFTCHWCGAQATEADHLRSRSEGGHPYDMGNLVAACKRCNSSRGGEAAKARELGAVLGSRRRMRSGRAAEPTEGAIRV